MSACSSCVTFTVNGLLYISGRRSDLDVEVPDITATVALGHAHRFAAGMAARSSRRDRESGRLDDEGVAFPSAD